MKALSLQEITDLVYRRVDDNLREDLVKEVYATYTNDKIKLTFILGSSLDTSTLASIAVKYNHSFSDKHPQVTLQMLNQPNHFKPGKDSYIIWSFSTGYTIPKSYGG